MPGGFGVRGIEGKLGALRFARENGIPALGLCLGLQCMVIEYSRNVVGLDRRLVDRSSTPTPSSRSSRRWPSRSRSSTSGDLGGTMRLGLYEAALEPGSIVEELYELARGRPSATATATRSTTHYRDQIADAGLRFSGVSPDRSLVEFVELPRDVHPFYVGTQAHPELRSRPEPRASAVPRTDRRGARAPAGDAACSRWRGRVDRARRDDVVTAGAEV